MSFRYRVEDVLPHAPPMILIDEIISKGPDSLSAGVTIRPGIPFFVAARGVPAHVAIEWMAQTCGAFVGVEALDAGQAVRLGLLLGTRTFRARTPWFRPEERLLVTATVVLRDQDFGAFDCAVAGPNAEGRATARLLVQNLSNSAGLLATRDAELGNE
jgi:predicted hotdog family 3-hydroxylacyl-ACP dehydratase